MPKIVDKKQKRAEIATAAIKLFAQKGFEKTTIQEIATSAGIGKGTIYEYFKTKDDILKQASEEIFKQLEQALHNNFNSSANPSEQISALSMMVLSVGKEVEQIFIVYLELWLRNMRTHKYADFMNIFHVLLGEMREVLANIIESGKKTGAFRADADSRALAIYLLASFDGIFMHYLLDSSAFDLVEVAKAFINNFIKGLERT
ncbi:TetR/AcrR family transcriptional regulator [Desulfobacterales bacterium HSG16]|nr:TetR/AcrR family transcriptional regulator [Desulfobacterales bacterium HSG16]